MDTASVQDTLEIHEQLARYARGVDTKDWELWKSVFVPTAVVDYTSAGGPVGSPEEVATWLEQGLRSVPMTQHLISNIEVELNEGEARVRAMFYNPMQLPGMAEMSFCGGYYHHDFVRTQEGWKSQRLVEENVWFVNRPG